MFVDRPPFNNHGLQLVLIYRHTEQKIAGAVWVWNSEMESFDFYAL